jgi:hypothetical protein
VRISNPFGFHNNLLCFLAANSLLALDSDGFCRSPGKLVRTKTSFEQAGLSADKELINVQVGPCIATKEPLENLNKLMNLSRTL